MRAPFFLLMASTCGVMALAGCKDDPKRPPVASSGGSASPGSGFSSGGSPDGGSGAADSGDAGACTDLETNGTEVQQTAVLDDIRAGTGGDILEGTYDLTDAQVYRQSPATPGLTDTTFQGAIRIMGTTFERVMTVQVGSNGPETTTVVSGTISRSGTNATLSLTCPTPAQETATYTVLSNTLITLTLSYIATGESFVYTKQP